MSSTEQPHRLNRLYTYDAPTQDDLGAVSVDGFDEDEDIQSENKPRVPAQEDANLFQGIYRYFHLYLNSRAYSSTAELVWGMSYAVVSTVLMFTLMVWMASVVHTGGDAVSSLFRVLYMLVIVVAPVWLIVNITPTINLIKRFQNYRKHRDSAGI